MVSVSLALFFARNISVGWSALQIPTEGKDCFDKAVVLRILEMLKQRAVCKNDILAAYEAKNSSKDGIQKMWSIKLR